MKNTENDKVYVGQTTQSTEIRLIGHRKFALSGAGSKVYREMRRVGVDKFYIEVIETVSESIGSEREKFWISELDSCFNGLNSSPGGHKVGGNTYSGLDNLDEVRAKLSASKSGGLNPKSRKVETRFSDGSPSIVFDSIRDCQNYFGIGDHTKILRSISGKRKSPVIEGVSFHNFTESQTTIES